MTRGQGAYILTNKNWTWWKSGYLQGVASNLEMDVAKIEAQSMHI